jgi:hypothetical protein
VTVTLTTHNPTRRPDYTRICGLAQKAKLAATEALQEAKNQYYDGLTAADRQAYDRTVKNCRLWADLCNQIQADSARLAQPPHK